MTAERFYFKKALPIWKKGDTKLMNQALSFRATVVCPDRSEIFLAGSSSYTLWVNGKLLAHGPARTAPDFYKVDKVCLEVGENAVEVCVSGYNCKAFSYVDVPSFLCAEVVCGGRVLAATGYDFTCAELLQRIRKMPRYTYQRTFAEGYDMTRPRYGETAETEICGDKFFISRDVPAGDYARIAPLCAFARGSVTLEEKEKYFRDRCIDLANDPDSEYGAYSDGEVECHVERLTQQTVFSVPEAISLDARELDIPENGYVDVVFDKNYAGLISLEAESTGDATLYVIFDEILTNGIPDPMRLNSNSLIPVKLNGKGSLTTAEPYVMKYARIFAIGGSVRVSNFSLVEIAFPGTAVDRSFVPADGELAKIYDAAIHTFRTNVVDIYMDCASRERAGWLCDAFFMGRSEYLFTGKSVVEKAFLKNFLLKDRYEYVPEGMLPMCYPSSQYKDETFIPNWAMWYALELYEYLERSGDGELADSAKGHMYALLNYFRRFENEFGLLEKLEGWVFVEWSRANSLTQEVNFPSNMLYSAFKAVLGRLYGDEGLMAEAKALRETVNSMAMTESGFYCDNAFRRNGRLELSGECTEVCQYYAFWMGCATPETHGELWRRLVESFGSNRKPGLYDEIHPANAFIGNYLRLDLLMRYGCTDLLREDIKAFFTPMAASTGSLWEHMDTQASCSHGFASCAAYWIEKLENR